MRSKDQIKNLRNVLTLTIGPFALLMDDESIDLWADSLQNSINGVQEYTWSVKVKTKESKDLKWALISAEPRNPRCTHSAILRKGQELILKYPEIQEIQVSALEKPALVSVIRA